MTHPWHDIDPTLGDHVREIRRFFQDYKVLENKTVEVAELKGADEARGALQDAIALYDQRYPRLNPAA